MCVVPTGNGACSDALGAGGRAFESPRPDQNDQSDTAISAVAVKPAVDKIEDAESSAVLSDQFQVGVRWAFANVFYLRPAMRAIWRLLWPRALGKLSNVRTTLVPAAADPVAAN
jgi:hypothetical protein